jgi:coenzyme F420-dependent glucose-6-phosphate dehydrogenase
MSRLGLMLPSEEHTPRALVDLAVRAEEAGFDYVSISDHFHPWIREQGHSPFVWAVLGGIASATDSIEVGTAVTCPTIRMHPAIIAQASATAAAMMPGRFFLGLGSGENLNEHVTGEPWPAPPSRLEMLEEAIGIIRELWTGEEVSHEGPYYTVNRATLFTLPPEPPPILVAAASPASVRVAAENDGLITTSTDREMIETFEGAGGKGKPRIAQVGFCWDTDPEAAVEIAHRQWPIAALPWSVKTDLSTPEGFEAIAEIVRPGDVAKAMHCGPDLEPILEAIRGAIGAGFDHVTLHQIGPNVTEFIDLFAKELAPAL